MSNVPEFLTTKQAGEYIGRSAGAMRNLVLRKAVPFRKPAGRLVFIKSELDIWINSAPGVRLEDLGMGLRI